MIYLKRLVGDIRFWILLSFILRLYHITNPPLEVIHNWRQTTVTMPARNFVETGPDIFYPKVDFAGEKTGITGMEFPFLNYLIYLVSLLFGYEHWYGRLINLLFSCAGLFYFYKLIKKYFTQQLAFSATFILIFSIWFSYSRKIMPDTFSVSLALIGVFYGTEYFDNKPNAKNILLYFIFVLFGVLSKLPAGAILIVFLLFIFNKNILLSRKIIFSSVSLLIIAPVAGWYFYWVPYLTATFGFDHFFMGKSITEGVYEIIQNYDMALEKFYKQALGFTGFIAFVCCTVVLIKKKEKTQTWILVLCTVSFLFIVLKAGLTFCRHSYYIIPFAPVMAFVCGSVISGLKNKKLVIAILSIITIECILTNNADFYIKEQGYAILDLEKDLDKFSKRNDLIIINSGEYPTPIYFSHRKGWIDNNEAIADSTNIEQLKKKGLKFIVILKRTFGTDVSLKYQQVLSNNNYTIYKL
ncbi:MAG: glycosyltransferase family 39 protein [Bacteroidia bacterium]|nr:glycosyltransferase family 39 protein [Bacteroidia bacterium]